MVTGDQQSNTNITTQVICFISSKLMNILIQNIQDSNKEYDTVKDTKGWSNECHKLLWDHEAPIGCKQQCYKLGFCRISERNHFDVENQNFEIVFKWNDADILFRAAADNLAIKTLIRFTKDMVSYFLWGYLLGKKSKCVCTCFITSWHWFIPE